MISAIFHHLKEIVKDATGIFLLKMTIYNIMPEKLLRDFKELYKTFRELFWYIWLFNGIRKYYVVLTDSLQYARTCSTYLSFLTEAFRCHVHHFQCLMIPVELAAMFWFVVVGIAEILLWLLCLIVSKSVWDL